MPWGGAVCHVPSALCPQLLMARVALRVLGRVRLPEPQGPEMLQSLHCDFGVSGSSDRTVRGGVNGTRCLPSALRGQGSGFRQEEAADPV